MNVIVGLGNPGVEYEGTRHNVGFTVLDLIAEELGASFSSSKKTDSEIAKISDSVLLCKPQTFMNHSGQAVRAVLDYYHLLEQSSEYHDMYVVHDDLDIALGTIKLQYGTGPKSHNGLLSMYEHVGTKQFWHARVGVDNRGDLRSSIVPSEYVLQKFLEAEQSLLKHSIDSIISELRGKAFS